MEKVRCPHCGTYVEPPEGGGPFFCSSCRNIVDPMARRAGVSAQPDSPNTGPPEPAPLPGGGPIIRHGVAAGQTPFVGYLLALAVAAGAGYGMGWVANEHVYVPIVGAAIVGWLIGRALALGSGGGTPDRGVVGFVLLAAACVGASAVWAHVDYRAARVREADHWSRLFGPFGVQSAVESSRRIADRDLERDGKVTLVENGRTVDLAEESERAHLAVATGVPSNDPFDVHLLAATGKKGFEGYLAHRAKEGRVVRVRPADEGWRLGGPATLALAAAELLTMLGFAFHRRD